MVSIQHKPDVSQEQLKSEIISNVLWPVFEKFPFDDETDILINPSGRFVKGGAEADTGVTGRKLMVDMDIRICLVGGVNYDRTTERGYQKAAGEGFRI